GGQAYFSALTVGTVGRQWRPRPVEIAVVTDEGDEATTVVNPTSDLYEAATDYLITTRDVQLAPLLVEAWPALRSLLTGRVPIEVNIDAQLADIDFELKRHGLVEPMPIGVDLPSSLLTPEEAEALASPSALERARTIREVVERLHRAGIDLPGIGTTFPRVAGRKGYLQSRIAGPNGTTDPTGFVVGGDMNRPGDNRGREIGRRRFSLASEIHRRTQGSCRRTRHPCPGRSGHREWCYHPRRERTRAEQRDLAGLGA